MFRNPEFRHFTWLFATVTVVLTVVGFILGRSSGMLVLFTAVIFGGIFYFSTKARYQKMTQLADQIDLVLHNEEHLIIEDLEEGELSILQSEIAKMTLRIREQNVALKKEKKIWRIH